MWNERKIEKLFDSVMRGYPIGIVLLWETYNNAQYRHFTEDYRTDQQYSYHRNRKSKRLKIVLDGQQRLQSLYMSLYGSHNGKFLYFNVLSGIESDNFEEEKFVFWFLTPDEAAAENRSIDRQVRLAEGDEEIEKAFYCKVSDLMSMAPKEQKGLKRDLAKRLALSDEAEGRLDVNLSQVQYALTNNANILKSTVIDENVPRDSRDRKTESDVLEAFVRINTAGIRLSWSDLIFSMIKLSWKESATRLPEFVHEINKGNDFELDNDFVIRCLFAVSDLGTRFNIDLLRNKSNVDKIRDNYERCCDAIRSAVDFVQSQCWILSSKLLKGYNNLVPLVYYLFRIEGHQVPNSQVENVRKAVYLFGFSSPFSRYPDSRLGKFITRELRRLAQRNNSTFPLGDAVYWVWEWDKSIEDFGSRLVQGNHQLALHVVQGLSGARVHYEKNEPQVDHIFPRSVLQDKGFQDAEVNNFGNFWILAKGKNLNKNKRHPREYFADVSDAELRRAYIDRKLLDYRTYRKFLRWRQKKILNHIRKKLNLSSRDYSVRSYYDVD